MFRYGPYKLPSGHMFFSDYDPVTQKRKTVLVHREVMSKHLGRPLLAEEVVHHKDENPANNSIENLEIKGWAEHARHHAKPAEEVSVVCLECGARIVKPAAVVRRNQGVRQHPGPFCGKSCSGKWGYKQRGSRPIRGKTATHGSNSLYKTGCRCALCCADHTAAMRMWRSNKR